MQNKLLYTISPAYISVNIEWHRSKVSTYNGKVKYHLEALIMVRYNITWKHVYW